jgi:hypothetical protein
MSALVSRGDAESPPALAQLAALLPRLAREGAGRAAAAWSWAGTAAGAPSGAGLNFDDLAGLFAPGSGRCGGGAPSRL